MRTTNFTLTKEPRRELYSQLFDYVSQRSDLALLVVRDGEDLGQDALELLSRLGPFLLKSKRSSTWPGTTLEDDEAEVLYYKLTPVSVQLLKSASTRLYRWQHPLLPEDLCFLRSNGEAWFTSIAHEHDAYLSLTDAEFQDLIGEIPEAAMILRKDET